MKKKELLTLLSPDAGAPLPGMGIGTGTAAGAGAGALKIRPRGLINSGNMCFATSVLQMLVYTPPFHRLFVELGRVLETRKTGKVGREGGKERVGGEEGTPLVDATVDFLREFAVKGEERKNGNSGLPNGAAWGKGKGKGKERDAEGEEEGDEWDGESFLPGYVYDALKGKKRFENMGVGIFFARLFVC
jgi:ubiquitin carboxyl-terminal hydrolase 10